MPFVVFIFV